MSCKSAFRVCAPLAGCVVFAMASFAADMSLAGDWKTVDDKTGKPRSIVRMYEQNGAYFGKVEKALDPSRAERTCDKCTDDRKDKKIVGMVIVRNLKKDGDEYTGGDILDPDNGKVYRCKMKVTDNGQKLSVRGFLGISMLGRTQTWTREASE